MRSVSFIINGEPASKSNSRRVVKIKDKIRVIKSKKALAYDAMFRLEAPDVDLFEGDVELDIKIWYASRRPDLSIELICDCMQGIIYKNDRQVKKFTAERFLDKENPRAEITVKDYTA